jgi:tetratricopeptide (TPR) repeat protein
VSDRFRHLELGEENEPQQDAEAVRRLAGTPVRTAEGDVVLAREAEQHGRHEQALQLYTRALRGDRGMIAAWVGQVQMLIELDEPTEARLWSDKALELFRNNGELLAAKAQACIRLEDHRAATACSDMALQSPGSSPGRWQARGEVLLAQGAARARDCFERSFTERGADWFDRLIVARIHLYYDKATAALKYAQEAVSMRPDHVYGWFIVGQCQEAMGWCDAAEASYERCLELAADFAPAGAALDAVRSRTLTQRVRGWFGGLRRR